MSPALNIEGADVDATIVRLALVPAVMELMGAPELVDPALARAIPLIGELIVLGHRRRSRAET